MEIAYGIDLSDYYREKKEINDEEDVYQDTLAALLKSSGLINNGDSTMPEIWDMELKKSW